VDARAGRCSAISASVTTSSVAGRWRRAAQFFERQQIGEAPTFDRGLSGPIDETPPPTPGGTCIHLGLKALITARSGGLNTVNGAIGGRHDR
jgi:hypothetical protein